MDENPIPLHAHAKFQSGDSHMPPSSPSDGRERDKAPMQGTWPATGDDGTKGDNEAEMLEEDEVSATLNQAWPGEAEGKRLTTSYADAARDKISNAFVFSSSGGVSRKRNHVGDFSEDRDKRSRGEGTALMDMSRDMLVHLCRASKERKPEGARLKISLSVEAVSEGLHTLKSMGVMLYFMGRILSERQLRDWAKASFGAHAFNRFFFLGKGIYLALCSEHKVYYELITRVGIKSNGLFAIALPWDPNFDPLQSFMSFCPVWVQLNDYPVFLLPHLEKVASAFGKVLFMPKFDFFVPSRNVRFCVLWEMAKPIPAALEIDLGLKDAFLVTVHFSSFPHACYKCHQVGHFARSCPNCATSNDRDMKELGHSVNESEDAAHGAKCVVMQGSSAMMKRSSPSLVETQNRYEVLKDIALSDYDVPKAASANRPEVINLEEGHKLYVDLKMDALPPPHPPRCSEASVLEVKKKQGAKEMHGTGINKRDTKALEASNKKSIPKPNNSMEDGMHSRKESSEALINDKDKDRGSKQETSHPLKDNSNLCHKVVSTKDATESVQIQPKARFYDSKLPETEVTMKVIPFAGQVNDDVYMSDICAVKDSRKGSLNVKENFEEDWIYEPPPMPPSFGYHNWKANKYKIKGRLVDTPYGKKIYFRNAKVKSLKSFMQEFQLKKEDLVFLDA